MASTCDFIVGDDLDDLFFLLENGFLDEDTEFNSHVDQIISKESKTDAVAILFSCEKCKNTYKTERGLMRHKNKKHSTPNPGESEDDSIQKKLSSSLLKDIVINSAEKLHNDECFPQDKRSLFCKEKFSFSDEEASVLWGHLKDLIENFEGDAEEYYTNVYTLFLDNLLPKKFKHRSITNLLMQEVANQILAHLTDSKVNTLETPSTTSSSLTEKDVNKLQYLGGYILHKLHSKFRFGKNWSCQYNKECATILEACRVENDASQTLVNIRDRGGLWRVEKRMQTIFSHCEIIFRLHTTNFKTLLVCKDIVSEALEDLTIISSFETICLDAEVDVQKEILYNLLEDIVTLFVKVRTFSFSQDVREKHKARKKETRKSSLRTEIKKASSSSSSKS